MRETALAFALAGCASEPVPSSDPSEEMSGAAIVFAGDLAPARGVAPALSRDPWAGLRAAFAPDARWVVNLEAAVSPPAPCPRDDGLCLRLDPSDLPTVTAGPFAVLSRANNHASDFGPDPLHASDPMRFPASGTTAHITDAAGSAWAIVPLDLTSAHRADLDRALRAVSRARQHTPRVVGMLHSAPELDPRLDAAQRHAARALHAAGAVLVVGSGAHVIQQHQCSQDTLTYAGLGNLWMDQQPAATRRGLALGCRTTTDRLTCRAQPMHHSTHLAPTADGPPLDACGVDLGPVDDTWLQHPRSDRFVQVLPLPAAGDHVWVALWPQHSDFDGSTELRPYVFRLTPRAAGPPAIDDLWRGTVLSSPIALLAPGPADRLCVLHRTDDVHANDPDTGLRRWQAWEWTGFGFTPDDGVCCPGEAPSTCGREASEGRDDQPLGQPPQRPR